MTNAYVLPQGLDQFSGKSGLIAQADGTQANATQLPSYVNSVDTVAGAADSVLLPSAIPGTIVYVINKTATSLQVIGQASNAAASTPSTGDTIMPADTSTPAATATGVAQAAHTLGVYVCAQLGLWKQGLLLT